MSNRIQKTVALAALAFASGSALAHGAYAASSRDLSTLDKAYLKDTAQSNLEEVQLEPVVLSNAPTPQDREFGRRMKRDHAKANKQLERLAARVHYDIPHDISDEQKALIKKLSSLHGKTFEDAYRQEMIRDHTEDIAKTKREISLGQNAQVKINAQENLKLLQMHLKMSRRLPNNS